MLNMNGLKSRCWQDQSNFRPLGRGRPFEKRSFEVNLPLPLIQNKRSLTLLPKKPPDQILPNFKRTLLRRFGF